MRQHLGDVLAAEQDAALVRRLEAGEHAEQRGLAAAAGPQQRKELAGPDVERDAVDGTEVAERLGHALDAQQRLAGRECTSSPTAAALSVLGNSPAMVPANPIPPHASGGSSFAQPVRGRSCQIGLHTRRQEAYDPDMTKLLDQALEIARICLQTRRTTLRGSCCNSPAQKRHPLSSSSDDERSAIAHPKRRLLEMNSRLRLRSRRLGPNTACENPLHASGAGRSQFHPDLHCSHLSPQGAARVQKRIQDTISLLLAHPEIGLRTDDPENPTTDHKHPIRSLSSTRLGAGRSSSTLSVMGLAILARCQVRVHPG